MDRLSLLVVLAAIVAATTLIIVLQPDAPRIAYVRSGDVISKSKAYVSAKARLEEMTQSWRANIDTLESEYRASISQYNQEVSGLSPMDKKERGAMIERERGNLEQYVRAIERKSQEEQDKTTADILKTVNTIIEAFGKEQDYDLILGTTADGSVLYGANAIDITDQVVQRLNQGKL